jgi:hypothetical protein
LKVAVQKFTNYSDASAAARALAQKSGNSVYVIRSDDDSWGLRYSGVVEPPVEDQASPILNREAVAAPPSVETATPAKLESLQAPKISTDELVDKILAGQVSVLSIRAVLDRAEEVGLSNTQYQAVATYYSIVAARAAEEIANRPFVSSQVVYSSTDGQ